MTRLSLSASLAALLVPALLALTALLGASGCAKADPPSAAPETKPVAGRASSATQRLLVGKEAFGSWKDDAPGVRRLIRPQDLPPPYDTPSVDNGPNVVARPEGAWPKAPEGFTVGLFATGLDNPRVITTAPNGDLFVAESGPGRIRLLRDADGDGKPELNTIYATGLKQPFGIAFYPNGARPKYVYIANTDAVVRFPYANGDTKAPGDPQVIVPDLPGGGRLRGGGHWTRDIVFSKDNKKMWVSVGSRTNVDVESNQRASIHEYNPDGTGYRIYAWGVRNAVGLAVHPQTGALWCSTNERDGLGDDLVPDYISRVVENGFYGWPWFYIGPNEDPRHKGERPDLKGKITVPDVLIQPHSASLDLAFYTGNRFPKEYRNNAFASEHGSWNRGRRTGYKVIRVPNNKGVPPGEYVDFVTGFVTEDGVVWGRPVGVTMAKDGSLMITDDGSNSVWRVSYTGKSPAKP